ncbi:hypothetical protein NFJ02_17g28600 [Pycnococcus provasolii]
MFWHRLHFFDENVLAELNAYCTPPLILLRIAYEPLRVGSSFARHFKGRRRRRRRQWRQQSDMREPGRECAIALGDGARAQSRS